MKTIQDSKVSLDNFRRGLFTLRDGLATINEQEKYKKAEEFEEAFLYLISAVKQAKQNGQWRKAYFNLFETLGYQRLEAVHSNILAWLLNPEEAHGLGDEFLRAFVNQIFNKELPIDLLVKVIKEKHEGENRQDIVVEGNNWWLVIENKIDSNEQENQTLRYAEYYGSKGKIADNIFLVYLSPTGEKAKSKDFKPVSYRFIRELLERMSTFQGDSEFLVRHFINHINNDLEEDNG